MSIKGIVGLLSLSFTLSLACGPENNINTQSLNFFQCIDAQDEDSQSSCPSSAACSLHSSQDLQGVGVAFAFVVATGIATTLGALAVLVICMGRAACVTTKLRAGWLSAATGLMLYLAFAELWQDSVAYVCCKFPSRVVSYAVTASSFLLGIVLTLGLRLGEQFLREIDRSASWKRWSSKACSTLLPRPFRARLWGSAPAVVYTALPPEDGVTGPTGDNVDEFGDGGNSPCAAGEPLVAAGKPLGHEGGAVKGQPFNDEGGQLTTSCLTTSSEITASNQTDEASFARKEERNERENPTLSEQVCS